MHPLLYDGFDCLKNYMLKAAVRSKDKLVFALDLFIPLLFLR